MANRHNKPTESIIASIDTLLSFILTAAQFIPDTGEYVPPTIYGKRKWELDLAAMIRFIATEYSYKFFSSGSYPSLDEDELNAFLESVKVEEDGYCSNGTHLTDDTYSDLMESRKYSTVNFVYYGAEVKEVLCCIKAQHGRHPSMCFSRRLYWWEGGSENTESFLDWYQENRDRYFQVQDGSSIPVGEYPGFTVYFHPTKAYPTSHDRTPLYYMEYRGRTYLSAKPVYHFMCR